MPSPPLGPSLPPLPFWLLFTQGSIFNSRGVELHAPVRASVKSEERGECGEVTRVQKCWCFYSRERDAKIFITDKSPLLARLYKLPINSLFFACYRWIPLTRLANDKKSKWPCLPSMVNGFVKPGISIAAKISWRGDKDPFNLAIAFAPHCFNTFHIASM